MSCVKDATWCSYMASFKSAKRVVRDVLCCLMALFALTIQNCIAIVM